jgi:hypothetical protein
VPAKFIMISTFRLCPSRDNSLVLLAGNAAILPAKWYKRFWWSLLQLYDRKTEPDLSHALTNRLF